MLSFHSCHVCNHLVFAKMFSFWLGSCCLGNIVILAIVTTNSITKVMLGTARAWEGGSNARWATNNNQDIVKIQVHFHNTQAAIRTTLCGGRTSISFLPAFFSCFSLAFVLSYCSPHVFAMKKINFFALHDCHCSCVVIMQLCCHFNLVIVMKDNLLISPRFVFSFQSGYCYGRQFSNFARVVVVVAKGFFFGHVNDTKVLVFQLSVIVSRLLLQNV